MPIAVDTFDWDAYENMDETMRNGASVAMATPWFADFCEKQRDAAQRNFANTNPQDFTTEAKSAIEASTAFFQYAQDARLLVRFWTNLLEFVNVEQERRKEALAKLNEQQEIDNE